MFPGAYFPGTYFAPTYFPGSGEVAEPILAVAEVDIWMRPDVDDIVMMGDVEEVVMRADVSVLLP